MYPNYFRKRRALRATVHRVGRLVGAADVVAADVAEAAVVVASGLHPEIKSEHFIS